MEKFNTATAFKFLAHFYVLSVLVCFLIGRKEIGMKSKNFDLQPAGSNGRYTGFSQSGLHPILRGYATMQVIV